MSMTGLLVCSKGGFMYMFMLMAVAYFYACQLNDSGKVLNG